MYIKSGTKDELLPAHTVESEIEVIDYQNSI